MEGGAFLVVLLIVGVWLSGAWLVGYVAHERGRNVYVWTLVGLLLSPLLGLLAVNGLPVRPSGATPAQDA